ncbi:MAG: hypothetical protein GX780_07055 [Campylobacteraceae bacterium]|nr:hypothetical protein [Campylobacteraceae bacterium]
MKEILDVVMIIGFVLFMIFMVRGFYLQMAQRQAKREEEAKKNEPKSPL